MTTETIKRGRGRPSLKPEERAKRKPHSGSPHVRAPDDVQRRIDALVAALTADLPAEARASRNGMAERRLGIQSGRIAGVRAGKLRASLVAEWEAIAAAQARDET